MSSSDLRVFYPVSIRSLAAVLVCWAIAFPFLIVYVEWRQLEPRHIAMALSLLVGAAAWLAVTSKSAFASPDGIEFRSWGRRISAPWDEFDSIDRTPTQILFFLKNGRRFSLEIHARNAPVLWNAILEGRLATRCRSVFGRPRMHEDINESEAHDVFFETSDALIRRSIRRMMVEYLKIGAPALLILWLAVAIAMRRSAAPDLVFGIWIGFLALTAIWSVFLYFHRIKRMERLERRLPSRQVRVTLLPDGLRVSHALGTNILPWSVYRVLVQHSDVWFLYYSEHDFLIFPSDAFGPSQRQFVEKHLREAGGRVIRRAAN